MGKKPTYKGLADQFQVLLEQKVVPYKELKKLVGKYNTTADTNAPDQRAKEKKELPTDMHIGNRVFSEPLNFLTGNETSVVGHIMVKRAVEMDANLGEDDGQYLLDHQDDIPKELRGKVVFVFTDWRHPDASDGDYYVFWRGGRWVRYWGWLDGHWGGSNRVLRRKS